MCSYNNSIKFYLIKKTLKIYPQECMKGKNNKISLEKQWLHQNKGSEPKTYYYCTINSPKNSPHGNQDLGRILGSCEVDGDFFLGD